MTPFTKDFKISDNVKIVSFDIFDTLLLRPFERPTDIFRFMNSDVEKIIKKKIDFKKVRKAAEKRAKRAMLPKEDVKIDDIYNFIKIPAKFKNAVKFLEVETEVKLLFARQSGKDLYNLAKNSGCKLIAISDIYLEAQILERILKRNGFEFDTIFTSADIGKSKKTGNIYPEVLRRTNVSPDEILHIGDSLISDIKNAKKYGFQVFHLPKLSEELLKNKLYKKIFGGKSNCLLTSASIALMCEKLDTNENTKVNTSLLNGDLYNAGFNCFGSLLFAFTCWVHQSAIKNNISKLYYVSRDGFILHKAMQILFSNTNIKNSYFEVSRKSLTPILINSIDDVIKIYTKNHRRTTVRQFVTERLDCEVEKLSKADLIKCGFKSFEDDIRRKRDFSKVKSLVKFYAGDILLDSYKQKTNIINFLNDSGFLDEEKIALCDVGYKGTIQNILTPLKAEGDICGFYLLTNHKAAEEPKMFGFLESKMKKWKFLIFSNIVRVLEAAFLNAPFGSVNAYTKDGNPIKDNLKSIEAERLEANSKIWKGALDFNLILKKRFGGDIEKLTFKKNLTIKPFLNLILNPKHEDAKLFEGIIFENKSNSGGYKDIIKDKLWKAGFIAAKKPKIGDLLNPFISLFLKFIRLK